MRARAKALLFSALALLLCAPSLSYGRANDSVPDDVSDNSSQDAPNDSTTSAAPPSTAPPQAPAGPDRSEDGAPGDQGGAPGGDPRSAQADLPPPQMQFVPANAAANYSGGVATQNSSPMVFRAPSQAAYGSAAVGASGAIPPYLQKNYDPAGQSSAGGVVFVPNANPYSSSLPLGARPVGSAQGAMGGYIFRAANAPPVPQYSPDPNVPAMQGGYCAICHQADLQAARVRQLQDIAQRARNQASDLENREISPAAWGCRRVMGVLYQNCDALRMDNLIPHTARQQGVRAYIDSEKIQSGKNLLKHTAYEFFDADKVASSSFYIPQGPPAPNCQDRKLDPPVFYVADAPRISVAEGRQTQISVDKPVPMPARVRLEDGSIYHPTRPLIANNCSGIVSACVAEAGYRIRATSNQNSNVYAAAGDFANMGKHSSDCFQEVQFAGDASIRSGDIFGIDPEGSGEAFGHAMMIESVGRDPWGLAQITDPKDCRPGPINSSNYDFTIIHATSLLDRIAMARMSVVELLEASNQMVSDRFFAMAMRACIAKTTGRSQKAEVLDDSGKRRLYAFVRHDDAKPRCMDPAGAGSLGKGEKCLENCSDADRGRPQPPQGAAQ